MGNHDNIGLDSHNLLRPSNVGIDDPLAKKRVLDVRFVDGAEHSSLKAIRLGVVQLLEISDCLLLLVLKIYGNLVI
jgi:hypothetical protein